MNYRICDYFYFVNGVLDSRGWWGLKSNIYALILALVFQSYSIGSKGLLRFILKIGTGLTITNVIDKIFFNVLEFTKQDLYMILFVVLLSLIDVINNNKK